MGTQDSRKVSTTDAIVDGLSLMKFVFGTPSLRTEIDYVPNSFQNGAPKNPSRCYISVTIENAAVLGDTDSAEMRRLGWVPEQDGSVWVLYR